MKKIIFAIALACVALGSSAQRIVENINRGWSFTPGWEVRRDVGSSELVNIPHTWNLDALSGKIDYYRGLGNYLRELTIPKEWQGQKVYLRFKGVNHTAEVYVNARRLGAHSGGYTAFGYDITAYLNYGGFNTLWVRVSNAQELGVMPLVGDFNIYGGIYRDVELIVTPPIHLSHTAHATTGVYITPTYVTTDRATVNVNAHVAGIAGRFSDIHFTLRDADGVVVDSTNRRVKIDIKGSTEITWSTTIQSPRLWNGTEDPHQYSLDVVAYSVDSPTVKVPVVQRDSIREHFGLRYYEINDQNQFLLNGQPYRIKGVCRYQDVAMLGGAVYPEHHRRDIDLMVEMGVNAVRLSHYPQDPYFIELCDRAGIIVWSEIPFVGPSGFRDTGFNDSDAFKENGEQQLVEMIRQLYNHPSILFWGLFNELTQRGEDPLQYVKYLNSVAQDEDGFRLTTAASNQDGDLNFVSDVIGFNQLLGWSNGAPADVEAWGAAVRRDWPKLKVSLSQYGAGASVYQHQDSLVRPVVGSYWHPEGWQAYLHEQYWRVIKTKDYFWGSFVWSMFDFGSAFRREGTRAGINDSGLVTFDRSIRKDAFYYYKANWNSEDKMVYITDRRYDVRSKSVQSFKVYSSCSDVQLVINDEPQGVVSNDGFGVFEWKDCVLRPGLNVIEALSSEGLTDRVEVLLK